MPPAVNGRKECGACREEQSVEAFSKDKRASDGFKSKCKACEKEYNAKYTADGRNAAYRRKGNDANPGRMAYNKAKGRAKKYGKIFALPKGWEKGRIVGAVCPYCGGEVVVRKAVKGGARVSRPDSPSLDCVDPKEGYTESNTVVCHHRCNTIKSFGTAAEHRMIADAMDRHFAAQQGGAIE